jgi:hypothetical protein
MRIKAAPASSTTPAVEGPAVVSPPHAPAAAAVQTISPMMVASLSREAAELQLSSYPAGTFLVRGDGSPEDLILSVMASDRCLHFQVAEINGHFKITSGHASPFFSSLGALFEYYKHSKTLGETYLGAHIGDQAQPASIAATAPSSPHPASPAQLPYPSIPHQQSQHLPSEAEQLPNRSNVKLSANSTSIVFCFLDERVRSTSKLYDLINLGNDVLEAEANGTLLEGELDQLRRIYKQQRVAFSEGCDKNAWVPNGHAQTCMVVDCNRTFTKTTRKHHCRSCGSVVCKSCSTQNFYRAGLQLTKVCHTCFAFLSEVADGNVKRATEMFADTLGAQARVGS